MAHLVPVQRMEAHGPMRCALFLGPPLSLCQFLMPPAPPPYPRAQVAGFPMQC